MNFADIYPKAPEKDNHLWVMTIPVISTCHITKFDDSILSNADNDVHGRMHLTDFGYYICIDTSVDDPDVLVRLGLSSAYARLLHGFYSLGYSHIRLDRDGDELAGIPSFVW